MNKKSSYLRLPKNKLYRILFSIYEWLCALTNPVWWILDKRSKTILDVGCGQGYPMQMLNKMRKLESTGVDLFDEYLSEAKRLKTHNHYVKQDITKLMFPPDSFDTVMCLQLIEHLPKKQGEMLLKKMEKIARYQVIVATPLGYCDHPEMDDNHLQKHLSGWEDKDFLERGYIAKHQSLRIFFGNNGLVHKPISKPVKAAIFILDHLLTPVYFFFPKTADNGIVAYKRLR